MSKKDKKVVTLCNVCKTKIYIEPEELKKEIKNFGQYIIRHGQESTMTIMQSGTLCNECLALPIEKRMVYKK